MTYKPKIFGVNSGNTGVASETAYAVLCGGTTSTNPIQPIAGVGTSGQWLTSNGAGALPTFQAAATAGIGFYANFIANISSPADGITYFVVNGFTLTTSTASGNANSRFYVPVAGTVKAAYGAVYVAGTLGTTENVTIALRLNNTTDTNITTTLQLNNANTTFNNTGLSIAVVAGDYLECKFISPTWVTNPTSVDFSMAITIQ